MFDSHCHPTDIADPLLVVRQAAEVGVHSLLACGYNAQSNAAVVALRQRLPGLPIAIGLHPWFASERVDTVKTLIADADPIAVGECGLDGTKVDWMPSESVQREVFESLLDIACQRRLPLTVHSRLAVGNVLDIIGQFPKINGAMHAFGGSYEQAKAFVDLGWLIGIGGAVTRANAHRIHRIARCLPLTAIVLETDAPAIGLLGVTPPDVRPAHLPIIAAEVARLRAVEIAEISVTTDDNFKRVFGGAVK